MTANIPYTNLDPSLFMFPEGTNPILQRQARVHILSGVARIAASCPTKYAIMFGLCLTDPSPTTRVNVLVGLDEKRVNAINSMTLNAVLKDINSKLVIGTQHPLNFILTTEEYDKSKFDQMYAPLDDKWLKYVFNDNNTNPNISILSSKEGSLKMEQVDKKKELFDRQLISAKKASSGIWKLSIGQADKIAQHFNAQLPKHDKPFRMLGNTGIMLYRPARDKFFLVKGDGFHKKVKREILKAKIRNQNAV